MNLEQALIRTLFEQFRLCEWLINVQQSFPTKQINRKLFSAKDNPKKSTPAQQFSTQNVWESGLLPLYQMKKNG